MKIFYIFLFLVLVSFRAFTYDDFSTSWINEGAVGQYDDFSTSGINEGSIGQYDDFSTDSINEGAIEWF